IAEQAANFNSFALALSALDGLGAEFDWNVLRDQFGLTFVKSVDPSRRSAAPGLIPGFGAHVVKAAVEPKAPEPAETQVEDAQKFADGLAEQATIEAMRASGDIMAAIQAAIDASSSPEDLKRRLEAAFADADLSELQAITEK